MQKTPTGGLLLRIHKILSVTPKVILKSLDVTKFIRFLWVVYETFCFVEAK
jgi:hypothetical protein